MPELKDLNVADFQIVPATKTCQGCIFFIDGNMPNCQILNDLTLLDLAVDIDQQFGVNCLEDKIIYQLKPTL